MRVKEILQEVLAPCAGFMHAKTVGALLRFCGALATGQTLTLNALGRAASGNKAAKHGIKAANRLLGNQRLVRHRQAIYRAVAQRWIGLARNAPVVLVDWTGLPNDFYALTASVAFQGRSVPLYAEVYPEKKKSNRRIEARFVSRLKALLPQHCTPVIVTDAGFYTEWCDAVEQVQWHFVARVRNKTMFQGTDGKWRPVKDLHQVATREARSLGWVRMTRTKPRKRRIILARQRRPLRRRKGGYSTIANKCRKRALEPWVLATSLGAKPRVVVAIYAQRMQIEQNYRDFKDTRWGWGLQHSRSHSAMRFDILILLATIVSFVVLLIALCAERKGTHRAYQANTVKRRVLSLFNLGNQLIANRHVPIPSLTHEVLYFSQQLFAAPI